MSETSGTKPDVPTDVAQKYDSELANPPLQRDVAAVSAGVVDEPLVARVPDQPPDAAHAVALVDDQFSVDLAPLATLVGFALKLMLGGGADTETVVD